MARMSEAMREQFAQENTGHTHNPEDSERRDYFLNSLTQGTSLQEHLIRQAELTDCSSEERDAILYLIGSIDDNGYLNETISNIALTAHIPYGILHKASSLLKNFDPLGIGTENLKDCLTTQLEIRGRGDSLAAKILCEHFNLLVR